MKKLVLFLFTLGALAAQSLVPQAPPSVKAGGSVDVDVHLETGAALITGVQYALGFTPAGAVTAPVTQTVGAVAAAAGKALTCGAPTNPQTCVAFAFNTTVISAGSVAKAHVTFPLTTRGPVVFTTSATLGADAAGNPVTVTGGAVTVNVTAPFDQNGDGVVDASDLAVIISQVVGNSPPTSGDINGDGVVNIVDAALLVANP